MLLLRYQRQRQEEDGGGRREPSSKDMRRKINDRDLKSESHRAATRGTLICIFVCGSLLLSLGLVILFVGLLVPGPKKDPTPWLVIGPTCIVLGILVLLLSVEIILKLRKISDKADEADLAPRGKNSNSRDSWDEEVTVMPSDKITATTPIPVVIHPATPVSQLNPSALTDSLVQHR